VPGGRLQGDDGYLALQFIDWHGSRLLGEGGGACGDVAVGGYAEVDGGGVTGCKHVKLGELGVRGGQADLQPLRFPPPAFTLGLGDPRGQVDPDVLQPGPLRRIDPQQRAPDAAVLVNAAGAISTAAITERDTA